MINFSKFSPTYLEEAKEDRDERLNDDKGKLFEILAGSHLHKGTHHSGAPNEMLDHFRDENQMSPKQKHDEIKARFDKEHPGLYDQIAKHARESADHIRSRLAADGHHTIEHAAWTSQKGDHKSFTGKDDPNSDADVMLQTNNGPIGVSLKYGSMDKPNLRNPGFASTEKKLGMEHGTLDQFRQIHAQNLKDEGIAAGKSGHQQAKQWEKSGTPQQKAAMGRLRDSALYTQRSVAQNVQNRMSQMPSEDLRNYIGDIISPKTQFQHYRFHAHVGSNGNMTPHMSDMGADRSKLDDFAEFKAMPHDGKSISVRVLGRRHGSENFEPVLDHGVKKGSGVTKGFNLTTKAHFLSGKKMKSFKDVSQSEPAIDISSLGKKRSSKKAPVKQPITSEGHGEHGGSSFNAPHEQPENLQ